MYDWIKKTKGKHLTVADWKKWKVGQTKDVAIFDRNFEEYFIWEKTVKGRTYKPSYFFKENHHKITKKSDFEMEIAYKQGYTVDQNLEVETSKWSKKYIWVLVKDGYVDIPDEKVKVKWSDISNKTRVGFRGPTMLWKDVKSGPDVYWEGFNHTKPVNKTIDDPCIIL